MSLDPQKIRNYTKGMNRIPSATYRLQFNHLFKLSHALELVPYFHALGITDYYCSPLTKAQKGSLHGYDGLDYSQINPEIGTETEWRQLVEALKAKGMGLLLDIVPNHMCASPLNKWWNDVLENGADSPYAHYFNINWDPPHAGLKNKILLPILDHELDTVIENQDLKLIYESGAFCIAYRGMSFPINPRTWRVILEHVAKQIKSEELQSMITSLNETEIKKRLEIVLEEQPLIQKELDSFNGERLKALLKDQVYCLSSWRESHANINYRRFFDINELASMRVEDDEVFDAIHSYILQLIEKGWITGLRVDHIDGLFDPEAYLERLQQRCPDFYVIVEKILEGDEHLRQAWRTCGTTGYDYLNLVNGLFVDMTSASSIQEIYEQFTGQHKSMREVIYEGKCLILTTSMSSELHSLARDLKKLCEYPLHSLKIALRDLIACFPVYRSYLRVENKNISSADKHHIVFAIQEAKKINPTSELSVLDFIGNILLRNGTHPFVMRFQQLTGPVMAKGLEDTALYRRYPLASLNEVGMNPTSFGTTIEEFHQHNQEQLKKWPHTLVSTFTHDTKRSEDVRARLNVLSENPAAWQAALNRWRDLNRNERINEAPDANEEYLLYQTLVGSWPLYPMDAPYIQRIVAYMIKAMKEAKIHTSWVDPNEDYEWAVSQFIERILKNQSFLQDFQSFIRPIMRAGMFNSLSQTLLKMTSPGVPDFYQGSELWSFTLVDPDNRQPVDYSHRINLLDAIRKEMENDRISFLSESLKHLEDGRLKLFLISQVLQFRKSHEELFQSGSYIPLTVKGPKEKHVIAYMRQDEKQSVIVVASRFLSEPIEWADTQLEGFVNGTYQEILSGTEIHVTEGKVPVANLLSHLPFGLLTKKKNRNGSHCGS